MYCEIICKLEVRDVEEIYAIIGDIRKMLRARGKATDIYPKYQDVLRG